MELDSDWTISGHINGGYLMAVMGAAASEALEGAAPLTISAHFLAPALGGGPVDVAVEVVRRGRLSTARVAMSRGHTLLVVGLVTTGAPGASDKVLDNAVLPDIPPWQDCPDAIERWQGEGMDLLRHLELRPHPVTAAVLSGGPASDEAVMSAWCRYRDGSAADATLVMAAWDTLPPAPWAAHVWGHLPTVSAQLVLFPGEFVGPLIIEARCDTLRDGIADETARVWDSTGRLVCSARQTAVLLKG